MRRATIATILLFCLTASPLRAQDWAAVLAVPPGTQVRIIGKDGQAHGRIALVEDTQLTLITRGKPFVIPRDTIVRLERELRDPLWNGILLGALAALALRVAFGTESCSTTADPQCTIQGVLAGAGLGAFIDYQIRRHPAIYRAPQPASTLLRWSF